MGKIEYFCKGRSTGTTLRSIAVSERFKNDFSELTEKEKERFLYIIEILRTQKVISKNYAKKIEGEKNLFEMRVQCEGNAFRTFIFTMDSPNISSARKLLFLNVLKKKNKSDYKPAIAKAKKIIKEVNYE